MDWKFGSDNPHTVIRNLRAIKRELIVIVVSGYPPRKESIKAMNIFKWITKPYDKNQLDLEIQRALYSHSQATRHLIFTTVERRGRTAEFLKIFRHLFNVFKPA